MIQLGALAIDLWALVTVGVVVLVIVGEAIGRVNRDGW